MMENVDGVGRDSRVLLSSCEERQHYLTDWLHLAAWLHWSSAEWMIYFLFSKFEIFKRKYTD
jgi:hypothetical protein